MYNYIYIHVILFQKNVDLLHGATNCQPTVACIPGGVPREFATLGHKIGSEFSMVDRGSLHVVSGDRALRCLLQSHTWGGHESWIKLVSTASARIASWQAKRCSLFPKGVGVQISSYPVHVQNVFEHGKPVRHSLLVLNLAATGLTCHRRILERRSFSEFWKRRREDTMPWYKQLSVFYSILYAVRGCALCSLSLLQIQSGLKFLLPSGQWVQLRELLATLCTLRIQRSKRLVHSATLVRAETKHKLS
jgi:hypothetical protein